MTNCPNCGQPINPDHNKCEYCGTSYFDLACIPADEPFYLRVRLSDNTIFEGKFGVGNVSLTSKWCYPDSYNPYSSKISRRTLDLSLIEL